jgi:hypothetical protein
MTHPSIPLPPAPVGIDRERGRLGDAVTKSPSQAPFAYEYMGNRTNKMTKLRTRVPLVQRVYIPPQVPEHGVMTMDSVSTDEDQELMPFEFGDSKLSLDTTLTVVASSNASVQSLGTVALAGEDMYGWEESLSRRNSQEQEALTSTSLAPLPWPTDLKGSVSHSTDSIADVDTDEEMDLKSALDTTYGEAENSFTKSVGRCMCPFERANAKSKGLLFKVLGRRESAST